MRLGAELIAWLRLTSTRHQYVIKTECRRFIRSTDSTVRNGDWLLESGVASHSTLHQRELTACLLPVAISNSLKIENLYKKIQTTMGTRREEGMLINQLIE
jgi:hypothetical protein